jgi:hypothetical protein
MSPTTIFAIQMLVLVLVYCALMMAISAFSRVLVWGDRAISAGLIAGLILIWSNRKDPGHILSSVKDASKEQ